VPYALKGPRYDGASRKWPVEDWVAWMRDITTEAVRVSSGFVVWVANGCVLAGNRNSVAESLSCAPLIFTFFSDSIGDVRLKTF